MATPSRLEIDEALVAEARALGLDVQELVETELRRLIRKRRAAQAWQEENREAIEQFNRYIEEFGTIGDEYRRYG